MVRDAAFEAACHLLGLEPEALSEALTQKRIVTPGEVVVKVGALKGRGGSVGCSAAEAYGGECVAQDEGGRNQLVVEAGMRRRELWAQKTVGAKDSASLAGNVEVRLNTLHPLCTTCSS